MDQSEQVRQAYATWERVIRMFVAKAEELQALSAVEVSKTVLLKGMKAYETMCSEWMPDEIKLELLSELYYRTQGALDYIIAKHSATPDLTRYNWKDPTDD